MGQLLVRQFDDDLKRRLRERAAKHGVSMEQEARTILQASLLRDEGRGPGLGTQMANLFKDIPDNDEPLPTIPDSPARPASFDE
ncbi:plasmid stabilization protein [Mesorhizobium sp. CAU 1732]|uniref:FitA-like ribbon-helix-helix domain-containing protein n=1 Tax=Mesorhizobium sp. CAU 1732 TaxID=3140358 RepID=UPI003261BFEB